MDAHRAKGFLASFAFARSSTRPVNVSLLVANARLSYIYIPHDMLDWLLVLRRCLVFGANLLANPSSISSIGSTESVPGPIRIAVPADGSRQRGRLLSL
jgi:hypothetical protein